MKRREMKEKPGQADPATSKTQGVQAIERALQILVTVATSTVPLSAAEVAERCQLNRTTAWRILLTLKRYGFVDRDDRSPRYQLGVDALLLFPTGRDDEALLRRSLPALQRLAELTKETVNLSVPRAGAAVAIHQIDPPRALVVDWVSRVLPPHATSDGKLYLAWLDDDELEALLANPIERYSPSTITNANTLRSQIEEIRRTGIAYTLGELDMGMNGVSGPILDSGGSLLAIISVSGPAHRLGIEELKRISPLVCESAAEIRQSLGHRFRTST